MVFDFAIKYHILPLILFHLRHRHFHCPFFLPVLALSVHICNVLVEDGPDAAVLRSPVYGIATATSTGDKESQVSL